MLWKLVLTVYSIIFVIQLSTLLRGDSIAFGCVISVPFLPLLAGGWGAIFDISEAQFPHGDNNTSLFKKILVHYHYT